MKLSRIACNWSRRSVRHLLVSLSIAAMATGFSGCLDDGSEAKLTKKRDEYRGHRDYQAERLEEAQKDEMKLSEDVAVAKEIVDSIAGMLKKKRELAVEIDEIEDHLESSTALLDSYRKLGERQGTAIVSGEVLGDITLKNGVNLKNATVTQLRSDAIGLKHSSGVGFYPIIELPDEIQKQFLRPPRSSIVASKVDPRAVLLRKPASLKSTTAASADRTAAMRSQLEQSAEERKQQLARMAKDNEARVAANNVQRAEYEKKAQHRKVINAKITALRAQISTHQSNISSLERARSAGLESMNGRTTRASAADQRKFSSGYEQKIASYNQAIAAIEGEIAKLEAQF